MQRPVVRVHPGWTWATFWPRASGRSPFTHLDLMGEQHTELPLFNLTFPQKVFCGFLFLVLFHPHQKFFLLVFRLKSIW